MNIAELARSYTSLARAIARFPKAPWADALSHAEMQKKAWAIEELLKLKKKLGLTYVLGGWLGTFAPLLLSEPKLKVDRIRSFDVDVNCQPIADQLNIEYLITQWKFKAITKNMMDIDYSSHDYTIEVPGQVDVNVAGESPDTIINTTCDTVAKFVDWWKLVPNGKFVVLQNTNFKTGGKPYVNTTNSLQKFIDQVPMKKTLFTDKRAYARFDCYMAIGTK